MEGNLHSFVKAFILMKVCFFKATCMLIYKDHLHNDIPIYSVSDKDCNGKGPELRLDYLKGSG